MSSAHSRPRLKALQTACGNVFAGVAGPIRLERHATGPFHAGAIIAVADETATAAAMWEPSPTGELGPALFPLTLQMSANLMKNTNRVTLLADAAVVRRGRTTPVVDVDVRVADEQQRPIAEFVATLLAPSRPAAPADRPDR